MGRPAEGVAQDHQAVFMAAKSVLCLQAGVYPNVFHAARAITDAAGVRGLFTGYLPNLLEDVPDMAFKFAAYESMRSLHRRLNNGRAANVQVMLCPGWSTAPPSLLRSL